jgi:DNA-directed RNA polymerase subunit N (RpoN/RPB10)
MKKFTVHKLKIYSGEIIEIRRNSDGEFICPVCGDLLGDKYAPYVEYLPHTFHADGTVMAFPTQNRCDSCGTQFGFHDDVENSESVKTKWRELREAWLQRVGPESPLAKQQLKNLRDDLL